MNSDTFSERYGFKPEDPEIRIREDAPQNLRDALLSIARNELGLPPSEIRGILCTLLRKMPDRLNWSEFPNIWHECQELINQAPWYRVYDFCEAVYREMAPSQAARWQDATNEYFREEGVGWNLVEGTLERRSSEAFEETLKVARQALADAHLLTARGEIHEALRDLSRRPTPDVTGAIQHAMAAMECTARDATGETRATLGEILKKHSNIVPRPLDSALSKLWGYASERRFRTGLQEFVWVELSAAG